VSTPLTRQHRATAQVPLTIAEAASELRRRNVSATELVEAVLTQADRLDDDLHVYATRFDETARTAAAKADNELAAGIDRGPLQGVPVGIKDMILTKEAPTLAGSAVRNPAWQRRIDARAVARVRSVGAVIIGKTTTAELAIGVPDAAHLLRETRNPWNHPRWAGGSSGGSAAGVAAQMFFGALGTDTGGSIRIPAAYCGVVGLRPTFRPGASQRGVISLARSLDVVGPLGRSAADIASILQAMTGGDRVSNRDFSAELGLSLNGLRIGVARADHLDRPLVQADVVARFEEAVAEFHRAGATVHDIELPHYEAGVSAVLVTILAEACTEHRQQLREQWQMFAPATRRSLSNGLLLTAADLVAAQRVRNIVRRDVTLLYRDVDLIVSPTTLSTAPKLEALSLEELTQSICTDYWSAVGNPVLSLPIGFSAEGMPIGMQIAGRQLDEATVIRAADAYQRLTDWHLQVPSG
jgi:aspartyl-tRNA(Asn)/glutamyl-tRNA(Gln) amidotransferase subunit A